MGANFGVPCAGQRGNEFSCLRLDAVIAVSQAITVRNQSGVMLAHSIRACCRSKVPVFGLSSIEGGHKFVVMDYGQHESFSQRVCRDDLHAQGIVSNHPKLRDEGVEDGERILAQWKRGTDSLSIRQKVKHRLNLFLRGQKGEFDFSPKAAQHSCQLRSLLRLIAAPLRLVLLPRNPYSYQNCLNGPDSLHPAWPIRAAEFVVSADQNRSQRQHGSGGKNEAKRAGEVSKFCCHVGILA